MDGCFGHTTNLVENVNVVKPSRMCVFEKNLTLYIWKKKTSSMFCSCLKNWSTIVYVSLVLILVLQCSLVLCSSPQNPNNKKKKKCKKICSSEFEELKVWLFLFRLSVWVLKLLCVFNPSHAGANTGWGYTSNSIYGRLISSPTQLIKC